jgi:tetratricopeptide (TPR) repeat protein
MRGWALVYAAKKLDNYLLARNFFGQALERNPEAVNAHAGIAWTSAVMVLDGWSVSPAQDIAIAEAAVAKALALDGNHYVAHHVRGFLFRLQKRTSAARDAFLTAIALNPNFAPSYAQLGITELELGRPESTIPAVERAIKLSPRDPALGPWFASIGKANFYLERYQDAAMWLRRAIDTGTPIVFHHAYLASALAHAGRLSEARSALAKFQSIKPKATIKDIRENAKSMDSKFIALQERLLEGLRIAGLPE